MFQSNSSVFISRRLHSRQKAVRGCSVQGGLAVLRSWHPHNIQEVKTLMPSLPFPILIKPRTQVHRMWTDKGTVAYSDKDLIHQCEQFADRERARVSDTNAARTVDAAMDENHRMPGYIHALSEINLGLKILLRLLQSMPSFAPLYVLRALRMATS
jgi:hypothetical protein